MAVITPTPNYYPQHHPGVALMTWGPLANGDSGAPVELPSFPDCAVQFDGTFGSGGTILLEGSIDGTTYFTLTDPQGNAISKTASALEQIEELVRYIRPQVSAGDGTTALYCRLIARRNR